MSSEVEELENELEKAHSEIHKLKKELAHWKSNHADMVSRCALLSQREDLPVDRIPAYNEMVRLQEQVGILTKTIKHMSNQQRVFPASRNGPIAMPPTRGSNEPTNINRA